MEIFYGRRYATRSSEHTQRRTGNWTISYTIEVVMALVAWSRYTTVRDSTIETSGPTQEVRHTCPGIVCVSHTVFLALSCTALCLNLVLVSFFFFC